MTDPQSIAALAEGLHAQWHNRLPTCTIPDHWKNWLSEAAEVAATPQVATLLREAEIGRAVKRLPKWWSVERGREDWIVRDAADTAVGDGPTLPAAIAAALGDEP